MPAESEKQRNGSGAGEKGRGKTAVQGEKRRSERRKEMRSGKELSGIAERVSGIFQKIKEAVTDGAREQVGWSGPLSGTEEEKPESPFGAALRASADPAKGVLAGLFAALLSFGQLPLAAAPFGLAFLIAAERYVPYCLAGVMTAAVFLPSPLEKIGGAAAAFLLRLAFSHWYSPKKEDRFREPLTLRITAALFSCFLSGMYRVISGGFLYYDLGGAICEMCACALAVPLFCGAVPASGGSGARYEAGVSALMFAAVFSLRGGTVLGFSLARVAAALLTFYASGQSEKEGLYKGVCTGMICGLGVSAASAPAFALSALVSGLLWKTGIWAAVGAAAAAATFVTVLEEGLGQLRSVLPDLLAAGAIYLPLARFRLLPSFALYSSKDRVPPTVVAAGAISGQQQRDCRERLTGVSSALSELSSLCRSLSGRLRRPEKEECRRITSESFHRVCRGCARSGICWGSDYEKTARVIGKLSGNLVSKGRCSASDLPEEFSDRCQNSPALLRGLNREYSKARQRLISEDSSERFASDCAVMAKLIREAASGREEEYVKNDELSRKTAAAADRLDISIGPVAVYGSRRLKILAGGVEPARMRVGADILRQAFGAACGVQFSSPRLHIDDGYISLSLVQEKRFSLQCAHRSESAPESEAAEYINIGGDFNGGDGGGTEGLKMPERTEHFGNGRNRNGGKDGICGDTALRFSDGDDREFFLISDGMGCGSEAALTSRICAVFLQKLLGAGVGSDSALRFLGNFLRGRGSAHEISATVDLLCVDLLDGSACFVKSGAVPSYILRDGSLFEISSRTAPLGITEAGTAEEVRFGLRGGDVVVMVSDGVAASHEEDSWLGELLCEEWKDDLDAMADAILEKAKSITARRGRSPDDLSAALIRVNEIAEGGGRRKEA